MSKVTSAYGLLASAMTGKVSTAYGTAGAGSGTNEFVSVAYRGAARYSTLTGNYNRDSSYAGLNDGKGMFPSLDSAVNFRSSPNVSYSFWIKTPSSNIGLQLRNVYSERYYNGSAVNQSYCSFYLREDFIGIYSTYNGSGNYKTFDISSILDGDWHHFCVTTNTDDIVGGANMYIDGVLASSSGSGLSNTITRTSHHIYNIIVGGTLLADNAGLGSYYGSWAATGTFTMDDLASWKKTLTASEVSAIYGAGLNGDLTSVSASSDLERWFKFGDTIGDGVDIKDSQNTTYVITSFDGNDNTTV